MNCKGSTKDINSNFFLFKDTSFHFKSVFLQIFKHEFRDLETSLNLSLPKTTWVSLLYHIDQLSYLKSKKSARFAGTFSSRASLVSLSTPRARDLIIALRAPFFLDLALRAWSCALRIHLSLFLII